MEVAPLNRFYGFYLDHMADLCLNDCQFLSATALQRTVTRLAPPGVQV